MFTPPDDVPDSLVAETLLSGWSLEVDSITYAPVGLGSHHWYVTASGHDWFVTVDALKNPTDRRRLIAALSTARELYDSGLSFVVAPVALNSGSVVAPIGNGYAAALYHRVEGETHQWGRFDDAGFRSAVLDRLISVHCAPVDVRHPLTDDFEITGRPELEAALADMSVEWRSGPFAETARRLLSTHAVSIIEALDRYDQMVDDVVGRSLPFVVTHGEPHPGNTITSDDGVVLVDWDTALLAPPERDLWWLTREDAALATAYEDLTGRTVDAQALSLYQLRWAMTDVALFTNDLRSRHRDTAENRTAIDFLISYFDEGKEPVT